jgi:hypothetical protein
MMRIQLAALLILAGCADSDASVGYTVDSSATGVVTVSNTTPSDWSDTTGQWKIVQVASLEASDDTAGAIVSPSHVTVDGAGRLLVVEQSPVSLRLLEPDGTLVRQVGREGEGPGEYQSPIPVAFGPYLVVDDPRLARLTVFDTAGTLLNSFPAPCCHYASVIGDDSGRVYLRASHEADSTASAAIVRIDVRSGETDTVMLPRVGPPQRLWRFEIEGGRMSYSIPFQPYDVTDITPAGTVLRGWSGRYEYLERTFDGDSIRVVRREWTPVERPEAVRRKRYTEMTESLREQVGEATVNQVMSFSDIPAEAEPMPGLSTDGAGNVWVPIFVPGAETRQFDVFSPEGIWRGTINTPWALDEYPEWVGDNLVVTTGETEEGFPYIRVWQVEH